MITSSRQTEFTSEGLNLAPEGLTPEDLVLKRTLVATKVLCPYCLHYGTLWDFSVLLKNKQEKHLISLAKCACPDCGQGYLKKTLLKVAEMTMEEYAGWFWGANFGKWGIHDKVSWDKLKSRLRAHFSYDDSQTFWAIYWEFKDAKDKDQVMKDREAFDEYKSEAAEVAEAVPESPLDPERDAFNRRVIHNYLKKELGSVGMIKALVDLVKLIGSEKDVRRLIDSDPDIVATETSIGFRGGAEKR